MGLAGMDQPDKVRELAADQFPQTRLVAVLAMRRARDLQLARLLHDPDLRVATEAARAINDLPIPEAMPALAELAARFAPDERALEAASKSAAAATWERQLWKDRKGFTAARLASDPVWQTPADRTEAVDEASGFAKAGNDYVQRVRGTFTAPADGEYVFAVASDDDGLLLASPSGDPAALAPVATVANYVNPGDFDSQPAQRAAIALVAGQQVLLEARAFQGGGGNHLAIGVTHPDGRKEHPIGAFMGDTSTMPLLRRIVNANAQLGGASNAAALGAIAANPTLPPAARLDALDALSTFMAPPARDRVIGHWRPVDAVGRPREAYLAVLKQRLPGLSTNAPSAIRTVARELAAREAIPMDGGAALAAVKDATKPVDERIACLMQLAQDRDAKLAEAIDAALASTQPALRARARAVTARIDPARGESILREALVGGTLAERQAAVTALGALGTDGARMLVRGQLDAVEASTADPGMALDIVEAASADPACTDRVAALRARLDAEKPLGAWVMALEGGDAERGRQVVNFNSAAACLRCHLVEGTGGHAAPSLAGIANRHGREGLVLSLVDPNAAVAEGFGTVSSMPAMGTVLTPREVRDVVEYLSTLR
jgi:cytochrome c553